MTEKLPATKSGLRSIVLGLTVIIIGIVIMGAVGFLEDDTLKSYNEEHPNSRHPCYLYDEDGYEKYADVEVCSQIRNLRNFSIVYYVFWILGVGMIAFGSWEMLGSRTQSACPSCPICNRPMSWSPADNRWFCQYCQQKER